MSENPWARLETLPVAKAGLLVECLRDLDERVAGLEAEHPLVVAELEPEPPAAEPWGPTDASPALALCRWLESLLTSWEGSSDEAAEHMAAAIVAAIGPEVERLRAEVLRLRERCALLESASPDLAGVALDHRAPADRSEQGRRP